MKYLNLLTGLIIAILLLSAVAAGTGVFWQGTGEAHPFTTLRGETVMMRGRGLYRNETISYAAQAIGQDIVTLFIGIPLLAIGLVLARKGSMRGRLLMAGALGYFLYTYASLSFLAAFNQLFLVYVALFSLSLFAFIFTLKAFDPEDVLRHITEKFPRRSIAVYFIVVAVFLAFAWLGLVVPAMISGTAPVGLESTTTMVIQVLDLGVILPTAVMTAVLLLKKRPWGYMLSIVVLLKILTMGAALISMIIVQLLSGIEIDMAVAVGFAIISLAGIILSILTLRTIQPRIKTE
jgi:hypothetical protein